MSVQSEIRKLIEADPATEARVIAEKVLAILDDDLLLDLLEELARDEKRMFDREVEDALLNPTKLERQKRGKSSKEKTHAQKIKDFLQSGFYVPDKGQISWGDALEEDHKAHNEYVEKLVITHEEDIRRHKAAVALCRKNKVKTLKQVRGWDGVL